MTPFNLLSRQNNLVSKPRLGFVADTNNRVKDIVSVPSGWPDTSDDDTQWQGPHAMTLWLVCIKFTAKEIWLNQLTDTDLTKVKPGCSLVGE